jgi:hypothetical protein
VFVAQPVSHWVELLSGHMPVAPVNGVAAALDSGFVAANGMIAEAAPPRS